MAYSSGSSDVEQILGQFYVAFGQGAGCVRVKRETIGAIREHYIGLIEKNASSWEADAVQVLERVRTVGRLSALTAVQDGASAISREHFEGSTRAVQARSRTRWCG
jgi:hypothetical protein